MSPFNVWQRGTRSSTAGHEEPPGAGFCVPIAPISPFRVWYVTCLYGVRMLPSEAQSPAVSLPKSEPAVPILIVDDNVGTLQSFAHVLASPSYELHVARSGDEAM